MTKNAFLVHIHEESNGREHTTPAVLLAENLAAAARRAEQAAKNWYGGEEEGEDAGVQDGAGWWCVNGQVFVSVKCVKQIPRAHYDVLTDYVMALDMIDDEASSLRRPRVEETRVVSAVHSSEVES